MIIDRQFKEQEMEISRYRFLEREVTDPLAALLLRSIVSELEAKLSARLRVAGARLSKRLLS